MRKRDMKNPKETTYSGLDITRRSFLKVSTIAGAGLIAGSGLIAPEIIGALALNEKPPKLLKEQWVTSSCLNCTAGCAMRVRLVSGRAVSIKGNPLSHASEGKICPRAQISLQVLYDPDRVKTPLKRTNIKGQGIDPGWKPVSWGEALKEISGRLKALRDRNEPHKLLLLQDLNTNSDQDLISRFAEAFGTPNLISGEALENEAEKTGRWMADGHHQAIAYDLSDTNYILAFGTSILESQNPLSRNLRMWGKIRRERPNRAKVVVIDPRLSVTANKADEWITVKPGTDGALAMAIANVIIHERLYNVNFINKWTSGFVKFKELVLDQCCVEWASEITGIRHDVIRRIAREFAQTKPSIAWAGNGVGRGSNGTYSSYAVYALNALVGSLDIPGGVIYQETPSYKEMPRVVQDASAKKGRKKVPIDFRQSDSYPAAEVVTNQVAESLTKGDPYPIEVVIGINCNFSFSAPGNWRWNEALSKVPYHVHITPFINEMAEFADVILPASLFLEEWAYDHGPPGPGIAEVRVKQPVVKPMVDTRSVGDLIFELAQRQGGAVSQSFKGIGGDSRGFVKYRTEPLMPWKEFCERGVWTAPPYRFYKYDRIFKTPSKKFEFFSGNLKRLLLQRGGVKSSAEQVNYLPHYEPVRYLGNTDEYPFVLLPYHPLLHMRIGRQDYPWVQSIFLVMHGVGWTNFAEINTQTASVMKIREGDTIWLESSFRKILVKARLTEGVHPQVVSIALGQGHTANRRKGEWLGVNPQDIIGIDYDRLSGQAVFSTTRVKIYKA